MSPIVRLLVPQKLEVALYSALGFAVLVGLNAYKLWSYYISSVSFSEIEKVRDFASIAYYRVLEWEMLIDPRLADFSAWVVVGGIAMAIVLVAQNVINDAETEHAIEKNARTDRLKTVERRDFVMRWLFRVSGVVLLLVWLRIFFGSVLKFMSVLFFYGVANLNQPISYWYIALSIVTVGLGLYIIAVCTRLIFLRIRLFEVEAR